MGFERIRAPGGWTLNSVVDPEEFEAIDAARPDMVDGGGGGEYEPTEQIGIGGEGLGLAGENHEIRADAKVTNSGTIEVVDGGLIRAILSAIIRVEDGGLLELLGTADGAGAELRLNTLSRILAQGTSGNEAQIRVGQYGRLRILDDGAFDIEDGSTSAVKNGATWAFESGATVTLATTMSVSGQISFAGGSTLTVLNSGQVNFNSGSTFNAAGTNNLYSLNIVGSDVWPVLNTARTVTRPAARVIPLTFNNGASSVGPDDPDAWECKSDASASPAWRTRAATTSGKSSILEVLDLPIGAIITGASVTSKGTDPALVGSTLPTYQIVSWSSGEGGLVGHSSATNDAGIALTFPNTSTETTIGNTGTDEQRTVTAGRRYGILVTHPYENTSGGQGAWIYQAYITATLGVIKA